MVTSIKPSNLIIRKIRFSSSPKLKFLVFAVLLLLGCRQLDSQTRSFWLENYWVEHYTKSDNLPESVVIDIYQDTRGIIWITTAYYLVKYNGLSFKSYSANPTREVNFHHKNGIIEDERGNIWTSSINGSLMRFNPHTETFTHYKANLMDMKAISHPSINALEKDDYGNLWVGTNRGLNRIHYVNNESDQVEIKRFHPPSANPVLMAFSDSLQKTREPIAALTKVENLQQLEKEFSIKEETYVLIDAYGECFRDEEGCVDKPWITNTSGDVLWELSFANSWAAGGSVKNRRALALLRLGPGNYQVHMITDSTHAFGSWNDRPPRNKANWGIQLLRLTMKESDALKFYFKNEFFNLPNSSATADILKDHQGKLWLAAGKGIEVLTINSTDPMRKLQFQHLDYSLSQLLINYRLAIGSNNKIWGVGHAPFRNGIAALRILRFESQNPKLEVAIDSDARVKIRYHNELSSNQLVIDTINQVGWVASLGNGLITFPLNNPEKAHKISDWPAFLERGNDQVWSVFLDKNGNIWVASRSSGLFKFNVTNSNIALHKLDTKDNNQITALYPDPSERGYLIRAAHGLQLYAFEDDLALSKQPQTKVLTLQNASSVLRGDHNFWYIDDKGLWSRNLGSTETDRDHYPSVPSNLQLENQASDKEIWLSNGRSFGRVADFSIFDSDNATIDSIPFDTIPFRKGISFRHFAFSGNVFVSSSYKGLFHYTLSAKPKQKLKLQGKYFPYSRIQDIVPINNFEYWCGGYDDGLIRLNINTGTYKKYTTDDGLISNNIRRIHDDQQGFLWLFTDLGICLFNVEKKSFLAPQELSKLRYDFTSFRHLFVENARDDKIVAVFDSNFISIDRKIRLGNPNPPAGTILTDLSINAEHGSLKRIDQGQLKLKYQENNIAIAYAGLHYDNPQKNKYKYQMEGLNPDWVEVGHERIARFPRLSPGTYTFKVKAANPDGAWNETPAILKIQVLSPWWASIWAYFAYSVTVAGVLWFLYQFQLNRRLTLAEAERLKELDRVKTNLYTNITHEFRTPLTIIIGMSQQVLEQPQKWFQQGLTLIKDNGQQLLRLVNQMLELAKVDAGATKIHWINSDVLPFLRYVCQSFSSLAEGKDIKLHFLAKDQAIVMDHDPEKWLHILSNLITNAIKFTPNEGNIYLQVETGTDPAKPSIQIAVKDTGQGIPEDDLDKVFDRFQQVDGSTTRAQEGTGIGLALTKELVNLLGGRIEVSSELQRGTTFTVTFPIHQLAPKSEPKIYPLVQYPTMNNSTQKRDNQIGTDLFTSPSPSGQPQLLIIEDNKDVVIYLKACLPSHFQIEVASDGKEGIDKALSIIPDIIISDVMMPQKDGYEVVTSLKQNEVTSHIPILLLTAKVDQDSKLRGLSVGADAYLSKPFNKKELNLRIHNLLELQKRLQIRYADTTQPPISSKPEIRKEDAFVTKLRGIVEKNLHDEDWKVPQLASAVRLSREQLYRKLMGIAKQPPSQFIKRVKIEKGKELLLSSSLSIKEVAYQLGFKDAAHFTKVFKEMYNIPPSAFRDRTTI